MGFRSGSYCTVWCVNPVNDYRTNARISISKKNKKSGKYEIEFSGYVEFTGTLAAEQALSLKEKDRIRLGDVDVINFYDKEKKVTYTNFKIFTYDLVNGNTGEGSTEPHKEVDDGEIDDSDLPF